MNGTWCERLYLRWRMGHSFGLQSLHQGESVFTSQPDIFLLLLWKVRPWDAMEISKTKEEMLKVREESVSISEIAESLRAQLCICVLNDSSHPPTLPPLILFIFSPFFLGGGGGGQEKIITHIWYSDILLKIFTRWH